MTTTTTSLQQQNKGALGHAYIPLACGVDSVGVLHGWRELGQILDIFTDENHMHT